MHRLKAFTWLVATAALTACADNGIQDVPKPAASGGVRFFNVAMNSPAVHFYAGGQDGSEGSLTRCKGAANPPVTRNDSLCLTQGADAPFGIPYGSVSFGGAYVGIDTGHTDFWSRIAMGADTTTRVSSASALIEDGRFYSYYHAGFYDATAKSAEAFIIEDRKPARYDSTATYVRFVHAVPNAPAMTLYLTDSTTVETFAVGGLVAYKHATEFVKVRPGEYFLSTRFPWTTREQITRFRTPLGAGAYTVTARGDITLTSPFLVNRAFLQVTVSRWK